MTLPEFTVGLEEELFLVDKESGTLCQQWPQALWQICHQRFPDQIIREFLRAQVELVSSPAQTINQLHQESFELRNFLVEQAEKFNLAPIAAATHPFAKWQNQKHTSSKRYQRLAKELEITAEQLLACGMHIHIGISDEQLRLRLLNELSFYLPIILALSTSSPFWAGRDTGLESYRAVLLNGLPRSGLPPIFNNLKDYQTYLALMTDSQAIGSANELWWDLRLSAKFPTVELRIADVCTTQQDTLAIAALTQSLARFLLDQEPISNSELEVRRLMSQENRWRAQRYAIQKNKLLMIEQNTLQPLQQLIERLVEQLRPHAKALGCQKYLLHCLHIAKYGTSASLQRNVYHKAITEGATHSEALTKVTKFLIKQTAKLSEPIPAMLQNA